ncbi:MAG: biotin transporter BioY [Clostridiales bacterium]|jgi:biotin transport system substrate-specific component|nr:biotin transporter BioY [Clostridiales bacterium]
MDTDMNEGANVNEDADMNMNENKTADTNRRGLTGKKNTGGGREIAFCALFAALISVGSYIKIPLPGVPVTLQFLFTNLAGIMLGKKYGAVSVGAFVALGLIGLPVFSGGGGIGYVVMPSFGYILGYLAGAYLAGLITERFKSLSLKSILTASFANLAVVYLFGVTYFYFISEFYIGNAADAKTLLVNCFLIFLPGDILKILLSALILKKGGAFFKKNIRGKFF